MDAHHVENKNVTTPRCHHIKVGESRKSSQPSTTVVTERPHPKVKRQSHGGHGYRFIVVSTPDTAHQMSWNDGHDGHGKEGTFQGGTDESKGQRAMFRYVFVLDFTTAHNVHDDLGEIEIRILGQGTFVGNATSQKGGNAAKPSWNVTTNVVNTPIGQDKILDPDGCELHARVNGGTDGTTQWVPRHVIEPGEEFAPTVLIEVLCRTIVEIRIEFMNHRSVLINGLQTDLVRPPNDSINNVSCQSEPYNAISYCIAALAAAALCACVAAHD
mmetsp:Transcript_5738/g.9506  ORF Transcript_5738/g.9506 Transcript_5738/m.9506 type:complete len:271 (+) Transcript_5738:2338-3150(+)